MVYKKNMLAADPVCKPKFKHSGSDRRGTGRRGGGEWSGAGISIEGGYLGPDGSGRLPLQAESSKRKGGPRVQGQLPLNCMFS